MTNRPPRADDDCVLVAAGGVIEVRVLDNDRDPDGDPLLVLHASAPKAGIVKLHGDSLDYWSVAGPGGIDEFRYQVADGAGATSEGMVYVLVNGVAAPPLARVDPEAIPGLEGACPGIEKRLSVMEGGGPVPGPEVAGQWLQVELEPGQQVHLADPLYEDAILDGQFRLVEIEEVGTGATAGGLLFTFDQCRAVFLDGFSAGAGRASGPMFQLGRDKELLTSAELMELAPSWAIAGKDQFRSSEPEVAALAARTGDETARPISASLEQLALQPLARACAFAVAEDVLRLDGPEVTVALPEPGQRIEIAAMAGQRIDLSDPAFRDAEYIPVEGGLLVLTAEWRMVFVESFLEVAAAPEPAVLTVAGGPPVAADLLLASLEPGTAAPHGGGAGFATLPMADMAAGPPSLVSLAGLEPGLVDIVDDPFAGAGDNSVTAFLSTGFENAPAQGDGAPGGGPGDGPSGDGGFDGPSDPPNAGGPGGQPEPLTEPVIVGTADDDILFGRSRSGGPGDTIFGREGDDEITGSSADDSLFGESGDDLLAGGAGDDLLAGGPGDDLLAGGPGEDRLTGGEGADRMVADDVGATDTVVDFNAAQGDVLDVSAIVMLDEGGEDAAVGDFVTFVGSAPDPVLVVVDPDGPDGDREPATVFLLLDPVGLGSVEEALASGVLIITQPEVA